MPSKCKIPEKERLDPIIESQDMLLSNTHQQSLGYADFETRPPMLERGSYEFRIFTPSETEEPRMQKEEDLRGDDLKHYEVEIKAINLISVSILNDIYNFVDACTNTKAMWQRVKRLMRGTLQNKVDSETRFNNEFDQFVAELEKHVNIQSKNSRNDGRNIRRSYVQEEIIEGNNVQNDAGNTQRTLRTTSSGTVANVQCYNCSEKGHYARNCPKPRVLGSKYSMDQMLLAK
nr:hypothetical protein [Tanacetum cinerariifolium]